MAVVKTKKTRWKERAQELEKRLLSVMEVHIAMLEEKRKLEFQLFEVSTRQARRLQQQVEDQTRDLRKEVRGLQNENAALRRIIRDS